MKFYCLQHVAFEGPALIADWAQQQGHELQILRADLISDWPHIAPNEGIIVLGGPMSVHDTETLPWLVAEKAWLKAALAQGNRCLGLCLGAQLLAEILGGQVRPNELTEIGWFDIELTPLAQTLPGLATMPSLVPILHWHGETFSLPDGAELLASSLACMNQGFLWQRQVLAWQCHPEATRVWLQALVTACADELVTGKTFVQSKAELLANAAPFELWSAGLFELLTAFFTGQLKPE